MKENRQLLADRVRATCINRNWYTHGTCEAYASMLATCRSMEYSVEQIEWVTKNIMEHSNPECFDGMTPEDVAFIIYNEAVVTYFTNE